MRRRGIDPSLGAFVATLALANVTSADLGADVERVKLAWAASAKLVDLKPRLLERGSIRRLFLPKENIDPSSDDCTTVAVLGAPSTNFVLRFLPAEADGAASRDWPEPSIAGAAQVTRCGARKAMLSRVAVEMRSPRGVLEFVVARSSEPMPSLLRTLPHRDPGPPGRRREIGPQASLAPLPERIMRVQHRNAQNNGLDPYERKVASSRTGTGSKLFRLDAGCHRFDVLGEASADDEHPTDVDVIVKSVSDELVLVEDRSDNADASVEFCVGQQEIVKLTFQGAAPRTEVAVVLASWHLPSGLPEAWGTRARASMAEAVGKAQFPALTESPVFATLGVQGPTFLPVEVLPDACYLVVVGAIRGATHGIAIAVESGGSLGQNQSQPDQTSTSLAFCAEGSDRAVVEVEAHGSGLGWLLGVWQVGRLGLGESRP
ncbi:MAG TPA: hypothetical protein VFU02_03100 [Polyangiaceae bacterium]|nr:hypothetical protein [Polyangiaceae bacterium]